MYKKISNIAQREFIEKELGLRYKFPKLYTPSSVVDGTEESTLSVITMDQTDCISYSIWGLLPDNYDGDWYDFQKVLNTLHVSKENLNSNTIFNEPYRKRRCLIIVTGFFIFHIYKGSLYPYYVHLDTDKPFYIAGVYNELDDGFITCSMIMTKATGIVSSIQNLNNTMPCFIPDKQADVWLGSNTEMNEIDHILDAPNALELKAHPIAREFFKNDISYESMLEPVYYKGIPV